MCTEYIILPEKQAYNKIFSFKPNPINALWEMLHNIPDPRRAQGKRHPLPTIFLLGILAICCGYDSYEGMQDYAFDYQEKIDKEIPFLSGHTPNASTFQRVFSKVTVTLLEEVLASFLKTIITVETGEGIALDGKTIHGTGIHIVSAFAHKAMAILFEIGTDTKGKELVIGPEVINYLNITNNVITADALFAQKDFCSLIAQKQGGYIIRVKENQKTLEENIRIFFKNPSSELSTYHNIQKVKGQIEEREVTVSSDHSMLSYLQWPGLTHIWQQRKTITNKNGVTTVVSVGIARITEITQGKTPIAEKIAEGIKAHWGIETREHRIRDVTFNEDHARIKKGNAPQVMAALRNLVISIFHRGTVRSFPKAMRHFRAHPETLFAFLGVQTHANTYLAL